MFLLELSCVSIYILCLETGRSAVWLARLVRDQEVGGSNPLAPTKLTHWPVQWVTVIIF